MFCLQILAWQSCGFWHGITELGVYYSQSNFQSDLHSQYKCIHQTRCQYYLTEKCMEYTTCRRKDHSELWSASNQLACYNMFIYKIVYICVCMCDCAAELNYKINYKIRENKTAPWKFHVSIWSRNILVWCKKVNIKNDS